MTEPGTIASYTRSGTGTHPICGMLRELRRAARLSLMQFEDKYGIPAVVVGAYERGDRVPPLNKLEAILGCYGYRLAAVPTDSEAVRRPVDMVADLRAIANQLEETDVVPELSDAAA